MAVIAFSQDPSRIWCKAGWAFRQVIDDVLEQQSPDSVVREELEVARDVKGLSLYLLEPDLAARVTTMIRDTAQKILSGEAQSGIHGQEYGDLQTVAQYHRAIRELLDIIYSSSPA
jgi:hypothetical protein